MEVGCKILYKEEKAFEEYSSQRLLRIVFQEEIHPITELTTAADLQEAFRGVFECHRWLYEKAEIMHRDVSLKNLMYRRIDGKVYGVLNDFDLSVFRDDAHLSTSHLRTGTKPHMALDLLVLGPPPPHLYRFNLESLFYPEYHDGKKIVNLKPPFDAWDHLPITLLCDNKWRFITTPILEVSPTPKFLKLEPFMEDLYDMFMEGYNARGPGKAVIARRRRLRALAPTNSDEYHFDEETLGGNITFEKFAKILNDQDPNSQ
ncbi:hypothetical protein C8F01DRAFT_1120406 [Mycena amicta]|nr:hypothetical protein C8F01DRAFT_1120406 [Mycena amicta]